MTGRRRVDLLFPAPPLTEEAERVLAGLRAQTTRPPRKRYAANGHRPYNATEEYHEDIGTRILRVLRVLDDHPDGMTRAEIAKALGYTVRYLDAAMYRLLSDGRVERSHSSPGNPCRYWRVP